MPGVFKQLASWAERQFQASFGSRWFGKSCVIQLFNKTLNCCIYSHLILKLHRQNGNPKVKGKQFLAIGIWAKRFLYMFALFDICFSNWIINYCQQVTCNVLVILLKSSAFCLQMQFHFSPHLILFIPHLC